ncbi:MAG: hypothetical protein WA055_00445 [Candidatus Moraniibacteriota bacterium]
MNNLTNKYYAIVRQDNAISSNQINPYEWLMIIRRVFENCGKFLKEAFEKNSDFRSEMKTLNFHLSLAGDRIICPEIMKEREYIHFFNFIDVTCIFSQKIDHREMKGNIFFETWLVITIKGELLFIELVLCKDMVKPHKQVLISAYLCVDFNHRSQDFSDRMLPYLNADFAESIMVGSLDILNFDQHRRKKEHDEFKEAFKFYEMVKNRISFRS